jgi:hypothetical protein
LISEPPNREAVVEHQEIVVQQRRVRKIEFDAGPLAAEHEALLLYLVFELEQQRVDHFAGTLIVGRAERANVAGPRASRASQHFTETIGAIFNTAWGASASEMKRFQTSLTIARLISHTILNAVCGVPARKPAACAFC